MVRSVHGGSNQMNFDGRFIEKSPDLLIDLTDEEAIFPVIVECKIVDASSDRTVRPYCEKGIDRFVRVTTRGRTERGSCSPMSGTLRLSPLT